MGLRYLHIEPYWWLIISPLLTKPVHYCYFHNFIIKQYGHVQYFYKSFFYYETELEGLKTFSYLSQANRSEISNNILDSSDECKPLQSKEKAPLTTYTLPYRCLNWITKCSSPSWNSSTPRTRLKKGWTSMSTRCLSQPTSTESHTYWSTVSVIWWRIWTHQMFLVS